jgi:hypothetical protein
LKKVSEQFPDDVEAWIELAQILEHAQKAYECLGVLLNSCGLEESKKKSVEPTNRMTFLGVTFDTVSMTLEIPLNFDR